MQFTTSSLTSADGTTIGYRKTGNGPGLIICHGAGRISQNYLELAGALADHYTVYVPDRRGRGLSGPAGADYGIEKACEDLEAVIRATGAGFIFGHSAGGMIALETMLRLPVKKLAVYEPPVSVRGTFPHAWLPGFEQALEHGKRKRAMAILLKGLQFIEAMGKMPLALLLLLVNAIGLLEGKKEPGTRMIDLLPTIVPDIKMVMALDDAYPRYAAIHIPVLLMAGERTASYFHQGIEVLGDTLPNAQVKVCGGSTIFHRKKRPVR